VSANRRFDAPAEHVCAVSDVGRVRAQNEDAHFVSPDGGILVVADGMGGHAAGEVASALATESVIAYLDETRLAEIARAPQSGGDALVQALRVANERVIDAACDPRWRGMGTALIVAVVSGDRLFTCHVGDVRAYVLAHGVLVRLTRDHSLVEVLVQAGAITAESARVDPRKNQLTQAIGSWGGFAPSVNMRILAPGDRVLLCSDGLWEALTDDEIAKVAADGPVRRSTTALVDRANSAGGRDNITAVVYEHLGSHSPPNDTGDLR